MSRTIMLIPTSASFNLNSITLGVIRSIERKNIRPGFYKLIAESLIQTNSLKQTTNLFQDHPSILTAASLCNFNDENMLNLKQQDLLIEEILYGYHQKTKNAEVVLVEGLVFHQNQNFANKINYEISKILNAEIVFVMALGNETSSQIVARIELARSKFGGDKNRNISGVIMNILHMITHDQLYTTSNLSKMSLNFNEASLVSSDVAQLLENSPVPVLGVFLWNTELFPLRAIDIANNLKARIVHAGDIKNRQIESIIFCARSMPYILDELRQGSLVVTSADRTDVLVAACLAAMNGIKIGSILLTDSSNMDSRTFKLCKSALHTGLPVFVVDTNIRETSLMLERCFNLTAPTDDQNHSEKICNHIANHINSKWIDSLTLTYTSPFRLLPAAFCCNLTDLARKACKRIILPEGDEPRTVKAAVMCSERGIAECVLLGIPEKIKHVAEDQGVVLGKSIYIIDPESIREKYLDRLLELRKSKGMTEIIAREQLKDNVVLGTLMLEQNEVDGLVSGAVHTTANTIRPSLQLIKTAPGISLVSSVFFMLLPDQVLVYADCAINSDPTAEQLSEIAIQSADSASSFGIKPYVAMLSYSTGNSGTGIKVDKVRQATCLAQMKRPDLIIDGPLQYDAAIIADVAKLKAPNSPVAGKATVCIFPDLNTGNTTYKAVQHSGDLLSIGPMLQGMRKPVNDLSRGARVNDIVYTVALTAVQAAHLDHLK
ncbi:phosphate acetyltransferase [Candidatus Profftia tarda]|uniref:Phosphate acetyltransferase n=1 Tax=Candidatus Profftia tarda TaxID=1177216 RepID=A0A8E4GIC9_9ENTR|nr:phosphate acetyltransferase [Candidatus Profftia tarda]CAD6508485.1 Phosphate acetyltransferase [Candidatus Profftia tarda]